MKCFIFILTFLLICGTACVESESNSPAISSNSNVVSASPRLVFGEAYLNQTQPKLRTIVLWLGAKELLAEVAISPTEIATGMMYRTQMAENEAMLFVFSQPRRATFYMRNTFLPLSCAYMDSDGKILEMHDMKPEDETPIVASSDQVQYVLEVNQGWFERHNVSKGTIIISQKGSLGKIFFGK